MGLDTTHDCYHGAYSSFNRWRDELARLAGYAFTKHGDGYSRVDVDWALANTDYFYGDWPFIPCRLDGTPDPLLLIVLHSDCEGALKKNHLPAIKARLEELLPLCTEDLGGHVGLVREKTQTFIDGLQRAINAGEDVEFH